MNTQSLLTPPMEDAVEVAEDRQPDSFRQWLELPLLSHDELEKIRALDLLYFDECFVPDGEEQTFEIRVFFAKARQYAEQYTNEIRRLFRLHKYRTLERRIFFGLAKECNIVLLAQDWTGALEIYQKALEYDAYEFSRDPNMYYGLGLIYFHFKQYKLAIEAFTRLLYCHPTGRISLEAKVRLGACYMELSDYRRCLTLFNLANFEMEETKFMPKLVIRYNIALAHENLDELDQAENEYERLQNDIDIFYRTHSYSFNQETEEEISRMRGAIYRQLGWIEYRRSYRDEANRIDHLRKAQDALHQAQKQDPHDGQSFYYLGRVYAENENILRTVGNDGSAVGHETANDAFVNYRQSIDKAEKNADTWCSIGALYQRENQPMDALQAFICAVELNPAHSAAWTDLGELYQRNAQFHDALECFKNAMKHNPVAPDPIRARVQFLEKELAVPPPTRPATIPFVFGREIPSLKEAYSQPIPLELRNRQDDAYTARESRYDTAFWDLWTEFKPTQIPLMDHVEYFNPVATPLREVEHRVMILLKQNESLLIKAEREVLECLEANDYVFQNRIVEYIIPLAQQEMPRVSEDMIQLVTDTGHLLETPRTYNYPFLPRVRCTDLPTSFSLISEINISMDTEAAEIMAMCEKRGLQNTFTHFHTYIPIFEEMARIPQLPKGPEKPIATPAQVKAALNRNERHPLLLKTSILTVENRKEAHCVELQRYLDRSTISCIRGLTSCLRLDLSLFSTKAVAEIDGAQEIEVRTQYLIPPETNCDHASQATWKCVSEPSYTTVGEFATYQSESFKHTLKGEAEKMRKSQSARAQSPKRHSLYKRTGSPPKVLKSIKFGRRVDLSDDTKWKAQISELSKLPAFSRLIAGSNMLSHLGHHVVGMNTIQLDMNVPGARTTCHQEANLMASVNINIGPGDCEWFAVPYEYWGQVETLCEKNGVSFLDEAVWPIMDDLLDAGIPVHRFTQKAGDMVYISGGTINWCQATGWCNNISWNVAPLNTQQLSMSLLSYEYNKFRRHKSEVPMQLLCWQVAKNVKFTNQKLYNAIRGVLVRSLAFLKYVYDWVIQVMKKIKTHARSSGEQSHFCMTCEAEVFSILFVKDIAGKFTVFCIYCAKTQNLADFIALQQFSFQDLHAIYDNMKCVPTNNNKMNLTA